MRLLLDTHILLWAALSSRRLPSQAHVLLEKEENILVFSVASLWEIAIKRSLGRDDFRVDPRLLRRGLVDNGYEELAILGEHTVAVPGSRPPTPSQGPLRPALDRAIADRRHHPRTVDPLVARYPRRSRHFEPPRTLHRPVPAPSRWRGTGLARPASSPDPKATPGRPGRPAPCW